MPARLPLPAGLEKGFVLLRLTSTWDLQLQMGILRRGWALLLERLMASGHLGLWTGAEHERPPSGHRAGSLGRCEGGSCIVCVWG